MNTLDSPLVSVVIPVHNREKTIHDALFSAMKQNYPNMEFVIVNDGSTDDTQKIVEAMQEQDARINLINNIKNQGIAKSRNIGTDNAKGEIIAVLDSDDERIHQDKIRKQVDFMKQYPNIGILGTNALVKSYKEGDYTTNYPTDDATIRGEILGGCPFLHSSILYTKEVRHKVNGYPEDIKYTDDFGFYLKVGNHATYGNLPDYTTMYNFHDKNTSNVHRNQQIKESMLLSFKHRNEYPNALSGVTRKICVLMYKTFLYGKCPSLDTKVHKTFGRNKTQ